MANHYFLPIKILQPLAHPHTLDPDWDQNTQGIVLFKAPGSVAPLPTDPDVIIGTKLAVGIKTAVPLLNANALPSLTVKANAAIGYDPHSGGPHYANIDPDGLKVRGTIMSAKSVVAPDASFDKARILDAKVEQFHIGPQGNPPWLAAFQKNDIQLGNAVAHVEVKGEFVTLHAFDKFAEHPDGFAHIKLDHQPGDNGMVLTTVDTGMMLVARKVLPNPSKVVPFNRDIRVWAEEGDIRLTANGISPPLPKPRRHRIAVDGPTYVSSSNPGNPAWFQVTNGPIVHVEPYNGIVDPYNPDGRHICIGNLAPFTPFYDPPAPGLPAPYGIHLASAGDNAGLRFQYVLKHGKAKVTTKKKGHNPKTHHEWKALGYHQDTVMYWGDDPGDSFRIRFVGDLPPYIDWRPQKKWRDRHADESNKGSKYSATYTTVENNGKTKITTTMPITGDPSTTRLGKKQRRPSVKKAGFFEGRDPGYRDIVVIEPDGSFKVNGAVYAYRHHTWSDARLKEVVRPIRKALDKVNAMRGISYRWRMDEMEDAYVENRRQLGVVAQEVEQVCPEAVSTQKRGTVATKTVDYTQLVPVLIEAIKEQQALIEAQRTRVEALERIVQAENAPSFAPPNASSDPSPSPRLRQRSSKRYDA